MTLKCELLCNLQTTEQNLRFPTIDLKLVSAYSSAA